MTSSEPQVDILLLAWNRLEFTRASWTSLLQNTDWSRVRRLLVYDDGSTDGTSEWLDEQVQGLRLGPLTANRPPIRPSKVSSTFRSPVAVMNDFLSHRDPAPWFAKIDSDTIVPPGWLPECLRILSHFPDADLLGIEAPEPANVTPVPDYKRGIQVCGHIGGIGLMRTAAFAAGLPHAHGRMGFSDWQVKHPEVVKAWLNPALPVILLDRLPFEPWSTLSAEYEAKGWQRPWKRYTEADAALWEWWRKASNGT